jgi:hypothetical protein
VKRALVAFIFTLITFVIQAQEFIAAAAIGGNQQLNYFIDQELIYPLSAYDTGKEGKVILGYSIDEKGQIAHVIIRESLTPDCDREAIRILNMIEWEPATLNGIPVKDNGVFDISFNIKKYNRLCKQRGYSALDNCDPAPDVTYSDVTVASSTCPQEYTINRTWTATDACGNSSTCAQVITVDDSTAPVITDCPANRTIECDESTLPSNTGMASATDNCDPAPDVTYSDVTVASSTCPQEYTINRTWTATDACGNSSTCAQVITVDDSTAPVITECPANRTIECDESTLPGTTGMASATDNCDPAPDVTYSDVTVASTTCPQEYTINRTWTATDACGNSSTCAQVITVDDSTAPVITDCPANRTIECDESTLPANTGMASATDNCDPAPDVTYSDVTVASSTCPQEYTINRTWTATDACGNSSTCAQVITVDDSTAPVITDCPANRTIECDESTLPANTGMASATDNCDPAPDVTYSDVTVASTTCPQEYTINRTWTATDACGNSSTCAQVITVDDSTAPVITDCPANRTIECDESTLPGNTGMASATDNCDPAPDVTYSDVTVASMTCPQEYTINRTWTATDACGNSSTCTQLITVDDSTAPMMTCPDNITIECTAVTLPTNTGMASATDNCDIAPVVTYSDITVASMSCPQEYTINRTWTATDACGNSSTCAQVITVDDSMPPMAICQNITVHLDENGMATITPEDIDNGSTDNCSDNLDLAIDISSFDCDDFTEEVQPIANGLIISEYVEGSSNNKAIEIYNGTGAAINLLTAGYELVFYFNGSAAPGTVIALTGTVASGDVYVVTENDASPAILALADQTNNASWYSGDDAVVLTKFNVPVDAIGQIGFDPGTQWGTGLVSTADNTIRRKSTITAGDTNGANVFDPAPEWDGFAQDDISGLGSHTFANVLVANTVILTVTDECGNSSTCSATVTVLDTIPPSITCPMDVTIECTDSTAPMNTGTATASDNCPPAVVTHSDVTMEGGCPQEYTITRTWKATDGNGNTTTCTQVITIDDSTPPTITDCPDNITIECDESTLPGNTGMATATDNCDGMPTVTYSDVTAASQTCVQEYTITRTWLATDDCGNSTTCTQVITVDDSTPPTITDCPDNITIECDESTLPGNTGMATATDNCDGMPTVTYSDVTAASQTCVQEYTITRTWLATDDCGNSTTCTQVITIDDSTPPTITDCPDNITIECDESTLPGNTGMATATDNCDGMPTVTYSDVTAASQTCVQEYTITRTWLATDDCGNRTTCIQVITIDDSTPPTITDCPDNITIECDESTLPGNTGMATATDNCDGMPTVTYSDVTAASQTCVQEYTITRTWLATDDCGNSTTCTQVITIDDSTPPTITDCPDNITIECDESTLPGNTGMATATDNCDGMPTVTYSDVTAASQTCVQEYTITRTWLATDDCGNSTTCTQVITIDDSTPPTITDCPDNITIECDESTLPGNTGMATATDNCDGMPTVTYSDVTAASQTCVQEYTITRTWLATDDCGNSTTCTQVITVDDSTPPTITDCPDNITIECDESTLPGNTGMATATDNCDGMPTVTYSDVTAASQTCVQEYTITRTWLATDDCGNSTTCTQVITIDDSTPPTITDCPDNITIECDESTLPGNTGMATATDNCDGMPTVTYSDVTAASQTCVQEYTITRTWLATDDCGNSTTCTQVITIDDSTPPTITDCPDNITIECDESTLPGNTGMATATDNCDGMPTVTYSDVTAASQTCVQEYTITRTWLATDDCGNRTTCIQVITIDDSTPPTITDCPDNITIECDESTLPGNTGMATATDNCDGMRH